MPQGFEDEARVNHLLIVREVEVEVEPELVVVEIDATDAAKKLAAENDVDLAQVEGSGAAGRIGVNDVRKFIAMNAETTDEQEESEPADLPADEPPEDVPGEEG